MRIFSCVKDAVDRYAAGKRVCVAVSGGSDSMCLLDCLLRHDIIKKEMLSVVNVDHGIRGEESARDSAFVREFCETRGVRLTFRKADIPALAKIGGRSTETAARIFRRNLFDEIISGGDADVIFTAHNADDRAESVLMHIFRGAGVGGLVGMRVSDGNIVRPLLGCAKAEVLEYIGINGVPFVEDSTNADDAYDRNFVRLRVLPLIKQRYPGVTDALLRLSDTAAETLSSSVIVSDGDSVTVPLAALCGVSARAAFIEIGLTVDFSYDNIADVVALRDKRTGAGVDLPHGYRADRESDCVRIYEKRDDQCAEVKFLTGELRLCGSVVTVTECRPVARKDCTAIDLDKLPKDAVVRTRRSGDRFRPIGGGEKSLSDWLIDKKIPRYERRKLLYVASGGEVLCVIGVATGEKLKIDEKTSRAATLSRSEEK